VSKEIAEKYGYVEGDRVLYLNENRRFSPKNEMRILEEIVEIKYGDTYARLKGINELVSLSDIYTKAKINRMLEQGSDY